ncbi:osmoprotectant transport system permease protein [Desulfofundulus australicus DSM 11792]|uniref:Osmoprotectant transport system permease protein n=1 Tax=Desulfofundulus australicus DSM 11792 TaxID=1121425 RepID=A0A1M4Y067_9FIRM|nr:ABC transporter permease [Desulfofundulus australicus]SHE99131.1 osmoprotectant transport system permease protein [Desulfofundulus australicus DSM 11792]
MGQILQLTLEHLCLSAAGVLVAGLVGVPLGILLVRARALAGPVMSLVDVLQTIPSLAMLALVMFFLGLGNNSLIAALFVYALLPILRNTYTGLAGVSPDLLEAGKGMGMTGWQLLRQVQLPIALPIILAGFRVAMVTAIGIATIGTLIGAGGLGEPIWRGIQLANTFMIMTGAVPAALLAIIADVLLGGLEKALVPRGLRAKNI